MLARTCSDRKSHSLLQNGTATSEASLIVSDKTKHTLSRKSSNHAPWSLLKQGVYVDPVNQIFFMFLFLALYLPSYKSLLIPFCSSPNGGCLLHEVLNKIWLYCLNCWIIFFLTEVTSIFEIWSDLCWNNFPKFIEILCNDWLFVVSPSRGQHSRQVP